MIANEEPLRFCSDVSAADMLFAEFGIPSRSTVKTEGIRNLYLLQATKKLARDTIRTTASPKFGSSNNGSLIAYSPIGDDIGAARIAMTVLRDATFDPRTELEFSYCLRKGTETVDLSDAVQKCGGTVTGLVESLLHPTIRTLGKGFGQARASTIQAILAKKVGEISIWKEAFATDGYASQDHGGVCSQHHCNPDSAKTSG